MGDEKTPTPGDKKDKPPAPVPQPAQKDQHTGPAPATDHKPDQKQATPAGQAAALQQSVGNQQANQIMRAARDQHQDPHAPGLKVSHPQDAAEQEAEAAAKKVTGEQPAHPHDHPGPAPGDPAKIAGDPSSVPGDPDVVHRAVADHAKPATPQPAAHHPTAPAGPQHPAPHGPSPTSVLDHPGPGQPVPQPTRSTLEAKLRADLSRVVVHHDAESDKAVRALQARAATRGNHIFLASDASPYDLSLMAHEVTHVLHHNNDTVHRAPLTPPPGSTTSGGTPPQKPYYKGAEGIVDTDPTPDKDGSKKTIELAELAYAADKKKLSGVDVYAQFAAGSRILPWQERPTTKQTTNWPNGVNKDKTAKEINRIIAGGATTLPPPSASAPPSTAATTSAPDPGKTYLLRFAPFGPVHGPADQKSIQGVIVGTPQQLTEKAVLPNWDRHGAFTPFNVDHLMEMQVGEPDYSTGAADLKKWDQINNYWLWEAAANQDAGALLSGLINKKVTALLKAAQAAPRPASTPPALLPKNKGSVDSNEWRIKVDKLVDGLGPLKGKPDVYWTRAEIETTAEPTKQLRPVTQQEAKDLGFGAGGAGYLILIAGAEGGAMVRVPWASGQKTASGSELSGVFYKFYPDFTITKMDYDTTTQEGTLWGEVTNRLGLVKPTKAAVVLRGFGPSTGTAPLVKVGDQGLSQQFSAIYFKPLSPIKITEAGLVPYTGFTASGVLQPSIPLFKDAAIDVGFTGGDIFLQKTFGARNIPVPAPLKITEGAITVSAGTNGFEAGGTLNVALGSIATGFVTANVDTQLNFSLDGQIDFDKTLFQPASIDFFYRRTGADYQWGVGGTLGIPPDKVPGIQQAIIRASYSAGTFSASGDATLSVPGLQSGSLAITYSQRDGISIGGSFGFAPNPLIESGSVAATVTKRPPGNRWALSASGTVTPKIPGVNTTLSASYADGVFTVEGSVAYARGMLSGSLTVGLTNRPLTPQGDPAGVPRPGNPLRPYGGGTLTAKIAPWLQGTVGVQLQQDGSVQLMGEIALPDAVNLFDQMQVQKNLLNIGIDIPIVGVSVLGQRIGIFATIQGGVDVSAGVGPGQLKQLGLKVKYNPEHEDQTQITGTAQLYVPAQAGVRLYVRGGLGAGIPVVSAEAGLEIGGQLGVQGAVQAGVTVNWTPKQGLVIDAQASLSAEPMFTFDINGYVKVSADLLFTTIDLYEKHWQLASFQYGSGLRVGVRAPIHYEQGKPFSFSLSDVQFEVPKIDPKQILTDLVHKIA